jgi:hypothetical protein
VNLPLFDPPVVEVPPQIAEVRKCEQSHNDRSDVLRVIQLKPGPWTELQDGKLTGRTWQAVELTSGQWLKEWDDGVREPIPPGLSPVFIADGLDVGTLVEVPA